MWTLLSPADSTGTPSGGNSESAPQQQQQQNSEPVSDTPDSDEINWDEESGGVDTPEEEAPQQKTQQPAPGAEPVKQEQPPAPSPDKGQPPAPDKPQAPPEEEAKPPRQEPKPEETPEQKAGREKLEAEASEKAIKELEEYYKLPDDLASRLATEPETVLPRMAAMVHQAVMRGVQQVVAQTVPQMIMQYQTATKANEESRAAFLGRWPSLKGHEKQVLEIGAMYRQMNPKSTVEDRLEKIGKLACAALGIAEDAAPVQGQPRQQQRPQQRQQFRPAATQSSQAGNAPPAENPYSQMAEEFLEDDQG